MKHLKYILFILIMIFVPNVYALDVSTKVEAIPDFGGGTYYGQTPTSPTVIVYNNIGTRYQGKLSVISFYLSSDDWNWSYSKTYTIELYMETNDWDNNFMYPQVYRANTNGDTLGSNLAKSSVTFVSNKKIKFTFKTPDDVMNTYLKFRVYSTNYNTTGITRITNYNFNKVVITENQTSGGSSGGSGGSTPTPTPTNSTDAIIDSNIQNTEDIINNNNQNTQDIIENANNNFSQATETITGSLDELLGKKCTNILNFPYDSSNPYSITATRDDYSVTTSHTVDLTANVTYKFSYKSNKDYSSNTTSGVEFFLLKDGGVSTLIHPRDKTGEFTPSASGTYVLRLDCNKNGDTCTFYDFMISPSTDIYCPFGSVSSQLDETNKEIEALNDKLDGLSNVIENAQVDDKSSFFTGFQDNSHGLTGIITAPLTTIQGLANTSCVPLAIPIPYTQNFVNLPCMTQVYQNYVPSVFSIWQGVSFGIISYFICLDIFKMVKGFKDPNEDKVEVLDL